MNRYKKSADESVLIEIRKVIKKRPSYGYKRVTAMISKDRKIQGLKTYNRKRIYRIMDMNGLIFKKSKSICNHEKTGKIITLFSNTRWCSDGLEIKCFNGEKVYVAFTLDCHDRENIGFVGSKEALRAKDIQELMIKSVESRFSNLKTDREIQFLSDRGSIYRAQDTIALGHSLGLKSCFTAAYSPQSNGMSEAFVNTLKRDYVYTNDCFDADTVLKMLPEWIEDYNNIAPHSGLGMKSPREYRNLTNQGV
jgi:putative transposase